MRRLMTLAVVLCALPCLADDGLAEIAKQVAAVPPTPAGEGHLGLLASGASAQVRFSLPSLPPVYFAARLGNVVGYSGQGTSYKLIVRRDSATGPVIYEGPEIAGGDAWNQDNLRPIDLTKVITAEDCRQGYLDLFLTPVVAGDGWTLYKDQPSRAITSLLAEDSPTMRAARETGRALAARGLNLIPAPQELLLAAGDLTLTNASRIVTDSPEDRFSAEDLATVIQENAGLKLAVTTGADRPGDIALRRRPAKGGAAHGPEEYTLSVTDRIVASAATNDGLWAAACTAGQLIKAGGLAPHATIHDWPAYPLRGLQYDVARGQTVEPEWWERIIRLLARCKVNALMVYGENDYAFKAFPYLGRPGTFTPDKAKRLSEYAHRYHLQLIPQFEALGHASAVLQAKELAPIREAGGSWVFCTSNPKTWEFLDQVFTELGEQFPYSQYLHVGADEFEFGFGKCPECQAKVAKGGLGGLYAEHMNKLNALCRKHHRTMLFWPSHGGPTPELSFMTVANEKRLQKDCIPTEWIYHGPAEYPELKQYQDLGFKDCWVSAAVVHFSQIWPDWATTWRGIRGFCRAGAEVHVKGVMTTTWEWMYGGLMPTALPGFLYSAECSWSLGRTSVADFERRYAGLVYGLDDPEGKLLEQSIINPWPRSGPTALLNDQNLMKQLAWAPPTELRRRFAMKLRQLDHVAPAVEALDAAVAKVDGVRQQATRNADLLDYPQASLRLMRHTLRRLPELDACCRDYREALKLAATDKPAAAAKLAAVADRLRGLAQSMDFVDGYRQAVKVVGGWQGDVAATEKIAQQLSAWAEKIMALRAQLVGGQLTTLPAPHVVSLDSGRTVVVGHWEPKTVSEQPFEMRLPLKAEQLGNGDFLVEWLYTRGAHGMAVERATLLRNGQAVSKDEHSCFTGGAHHNNVYHLTAGAVDKAAKYELVATLKAAGGTDSWGDVWLVTESD